VTPQGLIKARQWGFNAVGLGVHRQRVGRRSVRGGIHFIGATKSTSRIVGTPETAGSQQDLNRLPAPTMRRSGAAEFRSPTFLVRAGPTKKKNQKKIQSPVNEQRAIHD